MVFSKKFKMGQTVLDNIRKPIFIVCLLDVFKFSHWYNFTHRHRFVAFIYRFAPS